MGLLFILISKRDESLKWIDVLVKTTKMTFNDAFSNCHLVSCTKQK